MSGFDLDVDQLRPCMVAVADWLMSHGESDPDYRVMNKLHGDLARFVALLWPDLADE